MAARPSASRSCHRCARSPLCGAKNCPGPYTKSLSNTASSRPRLGSPKVSLDLRQLRLQHRLPATAIDLHQAPLDPLVSRMFGSCSVRSRSPKGAGCARLLSLRAAAADRGSRSGLTPLTSIARSSAGSASVRQGSFRLYGIERRLNPVNHWRPLVQFSLGTSGTSFLSAERPGLLRFSCGVKMGNCLSDGTPAMGRVRIAPC